MDFAEIIKYVGTFVAGMGAGFVLKISIKTSKVESRDKVIQRNNKVFGDQAGRDINKNK